MEDSALAIPSLTHLDDMDTRSLSSDSSFDLNDVIDDDILESLNDMQQEEENSTAIPIEDFSVEIEATKTEEQQEMSNVGPMRPLRPLNSGTLLTAWMKNPIARFRYGCDDREKGAERCGKIHKFSSRARIFGCSKLMGKNRQTMDNVSSTHSAGKRSTSDMRPDRNNSTSLNMNATPLTLSMNPTPINFSMESIDNTAGLESPMREDFLNFSSEMETSILRTSTPIKSPNVEMDSFDFDLTLPFYNAAEENILINVS